MDPDTTKEQQQQSDNIEPKQEAPTHVSIRVIDSNGTEVYFKLKKDTQMKKVFAAYCERKAVEYDSIRFLFNGDRITPDSTPSSLKMEDNDVIDALVSQTGGSNTNTQKITRHIPICFSMLLL